MGSNAGPKIPQYEKLVFHLDALNNRSHPGSGNTWYDISRAGISGTVVGTASFASGGSTASVYFNNNSYYIFGSPSSLDITPSITMNCIWINRGWVRAWQTLYAKGDGDGPRLSKSDSTATDGWYSIGVGPNTFWNSGIATSHEFNAWKMITYVFDQPNSIVKFYINGVGVSSISRSSALGITTDQFWVGANPSRGSRFLNGHMSLLQAYNGPLSDNEVKNLFNSYKGRYGL